MKTNDCQEVENAKKVAIEWMDKSPGW